MPKELTEIKLKQAIQVMKTGAKHHILTKADCRKGGLITRARTEALWRGTTKCDGCDMKDLCTKYKKGGRCIVEFEVKRNVWRKFKNMCKSPKDMFSSIIENYAKLEMMLSKNPKPAGVLALIQIQMQLFKLRYGERFIFADVRGSQSSHPTVKIMELMKEYDDLKVKASKETKRMMGKFDKYGNKIINITPLVVEDVKKEIKKGEMNEQK